MRSPLIVRFIVLVTEKPCHRDLLPGVHILYPGHLATTRDHLLHHDLHLGGGHTVCHALLKCAGRNMIYYILLN